MIIHLDYERVPEPSIDGISDLQANGEPFRLYNSMTLGHSSLGQEVYSPSPITISGVTIWSASPIRIIRSTITHHSPLEVTSTASLGASFRDGWVKLPDELKEQILSFNVVDIVREDEIPTRAATLIAKAMLFHHLRSTPEIATMSRYLYYKRNVFQLEPTRIRPQPFFAARPALRYPGPLVGHMIRSIHFACAMKRWAWQSLTRFSEGTYGFPNLCFLRITFNGGKIFDLGHLNHDFDDFHDDVAINELRFACDGELTVSSESTRRGFSRTSLGLETLGVQETRETALRKERMELLLRRTIHFGCDESKRGVVP